MPETIPAAFVQHFYLIQHILLTKHSEYLQTKFSSSHYHLYLQISLQEQILDICVNYDITAKYSELSLCWVR